MSVHVQPERLSDRRLVFALAISVLAYGCDRVSEDSKSLPVVRAYATHPSDEKADVGESQFGSAPDTIECRGERLVVSGNPIFTEADIVAATRSAPDSRVVHFDLDRDGTKSLEAHTSQPGAIGNRVAVRFGSRYAACQEIQGPVRDGRFSLLLEEEELESTKSFREN